MGKERLAECPPDAGRRDTRAASVNRVSSHVFMTERDGPMTPKAFHALFNRIGERAKMPFPVHPHMRYLPNAEGRTMSVRKRTWQNRARILPTLREETKILRAKFGN
jgi:hypothetical protein